MLVCLCVSLLPNCRPSEEVIPLIRPLLLPFLKDHPPSSLIRPAYSVLFVPSALWPGYLDTGDCLMHAHATPSTALFRLTCINKALDWQHPRPPSKPLAESWPAYDELERLIPAPASTKSVHFDFRPSHPERRSTSRDWSSLVPPSCYSCSLVHGWILQL